MNQKFDTGPGDRPAGAPEHAGATVGESARRTMDTARETGESLMGHAQDLAGAVTDRAAHGAERGKEQVADRMAGVAERVHETAENLRGDEAWLADLLDRGADHISELAATVKTRDLRGLLGSVEHFARAQPGLFAGAAVAVGFAAARIAMAPSQPRGHGAPDRSHGTAPAPRGSEDWLRPGPGAGQPDLARSYGSGDDRMTDRRDELSGIPGRDEIAGPTPAARPFGEEIR